MKIFRFFLVQKSRAEDLFGKKPNICSFLLPELYTFTVLFAIMCEKTVLSYDRKTAVPTKILKEYIIKNFVLNDGMLNNGKPFGKVYFDELLERIREIRASERRI